MELILDNARIVLADLILEGWVAVSRGMIAEIGTGRAPAGAVDLGGDFLIPGLVELHTDNLESHVKPRPTVRWSLTPAVLAYDAQVAAAGITTVFDSLRVGSEGEDTLGAETLELADAIAAARAAEMLRAEHFTHLRCEVCTDDVIEGAEAFVARHPVHLISLMDHTPGQRQFRDIEKLLVYYRGKGRSEEQLQAFFADKQRRRLAYGARHRDALVSLARANDIALASHDDATVEEVAQAKADGTAVAEFPVTLEAAAAARNAGIAVLMGAPNLVRGGSHSGNIAAVELAQAGLLDILSSDYVPGSMIQAAFELPERVPAIALPAAIATVTSAPAHAAGLRDRGLIEGGRRADLVRVRLAQGQPVVRTVWRSGERVV